MKRVFSGLQPTGEIHIGNWLGAIVNYVALGEKLGRDAIYCIVDYHAMTNPLAYEKELLAQRTFEAALVNMAAGLDPHKVILFAQSHVPEHTELSWVFTNITPVGDLQRMTQYKDKAAKLESVGAGLLMYPVLQAADILIYKGDFVPVGEDQVPHVELTREIARRFNQFYGNPAPVLPEPQPLLTPAAKLPGTDGRKMSKSYGNTILLADPEPVVRQKLKTMVTDPARVRRNDPGNPDVCPVGDLHKIFSTKDTMAKVDEGCRSAGIGCIECKSWAADALVQTLLPMQERRKKYEENPRLAWDILEAGSEAAARVADATMKDVRAAMGMSLEYEAPRPAGAGQ